ncbi:hypothetical protein AAFF_G00223080 [Aldrovandia affinis]|uniref:Uncharacterized protein n=1 Tax=Aldrovandia affinis TaxID=143900 RepID=A0AAD7RFM2_9TELE|nr:hypothetical protein AAFF_G00223080 [Aldrovandia affinis]
MHPSGNPQGDSALFHELSRHSVATTDWAARLSSDEGEKEENTEKLDCHYSYHHPRPAAVMENSSTAHHRTSTNSLPTSDCNTNATGFLSPTSAVSSSSYAQSFNSKSVLSYGTKLNACASLLFSANHPAYNTLSRQVSSSPLMPLGHYAVPSPMSSRGPKARPSSKLFRSCETPNPISNSNSSGSVSVGKKRKNSSPLPSHAPYSASSSSSSSSSSCLSFKRNCAVNSGDSWSALHSSLTSSSSSSSSHSGIHSVRLNCTPSRINFLSLKQNQSGRAPPCGTPAESIKRMSVVMNSSDSTLSLGPFVRQPADQLGFSQAQMHTHAPLDSRLEGKRCKGSLGFSGIISSTGGGEGGLGPGKLKMARLPVVNKKHGQPIPGTQGLPNNSLIQQLPIILRGGDPTGQSVTLRKFSEDMPASCTATGDSPSGGNDGSGLLLLSVLQWIADMAPYYEALCKELKWQVDTYLLTKMKKANEEVQKHLDDVLEDAEKNLGESEIRYAMMAKAEYLICIGNKVIKDAEILQVLHSLPAVCQDLFSLYDCRYSVFFQSLASVELEMKKDWLFAPHYRYYVREMRILAYSQLLESYRSLTLGYMAEAFGVSTEFIDQ